MEHLITHLLRDATAAVRAALRQGLAEMDLTPVQSTVLHLIADAPASSSAELSRRMHVTPQTMHKLVTELNHRGLLTLRPRPGHRRILDAHLTSRGKELVTAADAWSRTVGERMTAGLDTRQRQQLRELLQHCITALDTDPDDRRPEQPN